MYTVSDIRAEFDRLDGISGIHTKNIPIRISKRMTRALGTCHSRRKTDNADAYVVEITFSDLLCRYGTEEEILDTIRHEYAHAYNIIKDGVHCGHSDKWKRVARWLGANPERFASIDLRGRAARAAEEAKPAPAPRKGKPLINTESMIEVTIPSRKNMKYQFADPEMEDEFRAWLSQLESIIRK